jgi:hypothetical protein
MRCVFESLRDCPLFQQLIRPQNRRQSELIVVENFFEEVREKVGN